MAMSTKTQTVLESLSEEQLKKLHRDNPFRAERNEAIRELAKKGVTGEVLHEITGFSQTTIFKIINSDKRLRSQEKGKGQELIDVERSFDAFLQKLNNLFERFGT